MAIHVCTYRSTIRSGFDIQVAPQRITIHGVNGNVPAAEQFAVGVEADVGKHQRHHV